MLLYRLGITSLILTGITLWIDAVLEAAFPEIAFGLCFLVSTLGMFSLTTIFFYQGEKAKHQGLSILIWGIKILTSTEEIEQEVIL